MPVVERVSSGESDRALFHRDEAVHIRYCMPSMCCAGLPDGEIFLGADRLRRTPSGWRITHRTIVSVWQRGDPAVVRG